MCLRQISLVTVIYACSLNAATDAPKVVLLEAQINRWVNLNQSVAADEPITQQVRLLSQSKQITEICAQPRFSASGSHAHWQNKRTVIAQCDARRYFLQIEVSAKGQWYSASRSLKPGEILQPQDLVPVSGNLAILPAGALLERKAIIGQTTLRAILPHQPFTQNQLRPVWRVHQGQEVEVLADGGSFRLRSRGKAMNNALPGQRISVKTATGQRIQGIVTTEGKILISLDD